MDVKVKRYHLSSVIKVIFCLSLAVFSLYQIFSISQEADQYQNLVTRDIFSLISQDRPKLDIGTAITISLLISTSFVLPSYVLLTQVSKARFLISKARLSLLITFYMLIIFIPKISLFLYNTDYTLLPTFLFYISFCCVLVGAFFASLVPQALQKRNLNLLLGNKSYLIIIAACGILFYLAFYLNGIRECGFNLAEVYECRGNLSSNKESVVEIVLVASSTFLPLVYLLAKKSGLRWLSISKSLAFLSVYIMLFLFTGHKAILAISFLTVYFKYLIDKSSSNISYSIKSLALNIDPNRILKRASIFSLLVILTFFTLLAVLNSSTFVELRWIWALFVNRLILVPAYLDFVYVAEHIRGSLPDFGTAAVEAGRLITGVYGTWSNASYFGSSFVRAGLPRLIGESFGMGFILYAFCTQKKTVFLEILSYVGLLQCFIVLLSLDLQNALLDRGLLLLLVIDQFFGSRYRLSNMEK